MNDRRSVFLGLQEFLIKRLRGFAESPQATIGGRVESIIDYCRAPRTGEDVSAHFGWNVDASNRFLRALAGAGVITDPERSGVAPVGPTSAAGDVAEWIGLGYEGLSNIRSLSEVRADRLGLSGLPSLRGLDLDSDRELLISLWHFRFVVSRFFRKPIMLSALRTGKCQAALALGLPTDQLFDHYQDASLLLATYSEAFSQMNVAANAYTASSITPPNGGTVLDVGGGAGGLAQALAKRHPEIRIDLYDHPASRTVLEPLEEAWIGQYRNRIRRIYGDFFVQSVPGLAGLPSDKVYSMVCLGWVLHDWDDEQCVGILRKVARHIPSDGTVVVLEKVKSDRPSFVDVVDFAMLMMAGGRERTRQEYERLIHKAGLQLVETRPNPAGRDALIIAL